ncbi:DUF4158 domain-containing protein [Sphaerisporangium rhizosphaerae]|uniref:DUF4158 domain-containing protein n=1 Tax=Sphaerisporangium rhizosphaerae TaxID=2269375 RepID=A0ABW2PG44_9ACTN
MVEHWTRLRDEQDLLMGKRGVTRLGFALLLKYYTCFGRFPRGRSESPDEAVEHVARQARVPAAVLGVDYPDTLNTQRNLALWQKTQRRYRHAAK